MTSIPERSISAATLLATMTASSGASGGYRRMAADIAAGIERGDLPAGARLPAERVLAAAAGCSRGTVVAAYDVLREDGLVLRRTGSGTWVRRPGGAAEGSVIDTFEHAAAVRARRLTARVVEPRASTTIDLGLSALAEPWELTDTVLHVDPTRLRDCGAGHGYVPNGVAALRSAVADRFGSRGLPTVSEQVGITHGAQHSIALATRLLVRPGDVVALESPTFPGAVDVMSRAGARFTTVRTDAAGAVVADVARLIARTDVRVLYLVPTCHSPLGTVMPEHRRREIAALVDASDVWLIEDETLSSLVFGEPPPASIASFARSDRCLTVGSLAKEVWGGLGVGWLRASPTMIERLGRLRAAADLGGSIQAQLVALNCLDGLDGRTARLRRELSNRCDRLTAVVDRSLPQWSYRRPDGGLSLWCGLPTGSGDRLAAAALRHGVSVLPGSSTSVDDAHDDHVRLSFAAPVDELEEGVRRLAAAWSELERDELGRAGVR